MPTVENPFDLFCEAKTEADLNELRELFKKDGYPAFYGLITGLKDRIKHYEDDQAEEVERLIQRAAEMIPSPGTISPSWQTIWDELRAMTSSKNKVLNSVPQAKRDGEWQIIMDNPFVHQDVACYPGLSFLEAAYLYGYFRPDLAKNEYIRLQKVETVIMDFGA